VLPMPLSQRDMVLVSVVAGFGAAIVWSYTSKKNKATQSADGKSDGIVCNGEILHAYTPPSWMPVQFLPPSHRLKLAHLPTPIHRWNLPGIDPQEVEVWIKRDDFTGSEMSGNKVRKLDFLLADAVLQGCDCIITVGGIQSNHCRATAAAARRVGLTPHLIIRSEDAHKDPGLVGNVMVDRLLGAELHLVIAEQFDSIGGWPLVCELKSRLEAQGKKPFACPSGGSDALGSWGYVEAAAELELQIQSMGLAFDTIYFTCGSGGTAAGLVLAAMHSPTFGGRTSDLNSSCELVALGVDDCPKDYHAKIGHIHSAMSAGSISQEHAENSAAMKIRIEQFDEAQQSEHFHTVVDVARATGVVLDPVYSGKGVAGMVGDLRKSLAGNKLRGRPRRVLFIHTGGMLGIFSKENEFASLLAGGWDTLRL
jgi:D-cysteine desulfhydrase